VTEATSLQFVTRAQDYPERRAAELRARDFREIAERYAPADAEAQSARCSQCGVPYCTVHCPLGNHIPDWLRLTAEGRLREAYELSNATSTMPEICGRICPQDRLCEGNCVIETAGHGAVTIGSVEKFVTDTAWEEGWVEPLVPGPPRGQSVGVIGAGPAGLTAAELLRVRGYEVHVYDRHDRAGGLLTYGIPGFKLEKPVVMRRIERLRDGGIAFHHGFEVGRDATFAELQRRHDAVLVATGVYQARALEVDDRGHHGVVAALDYLIASNRRSFGDTVPAFDTGRLDAAGKRVVVIGGGDTAMDCVRTAVRQGAASVTCLYRRDRTNMPGSLREVGHAEAEGVAFEWLSTPTRIVLDDETGGLHAGRMRLGAAEVGGRRAFEPVAESEFHLPAELVITALGFEAEDLPTLFGAPGLEVTRWGTVRTDKATGMTSLPGVFAAGDIVRGASLVVWAIRDGRDVAAQIDGWLRAKAAPVERAAA